MKRRWSYILAILLLTAGFFSHPQGVEAARGTPQFPEFGYGVRLDISGSNLSNAVQTAAVLGVDWLVLDLNWKQQWPDANHQPVLTNLEEAMSLAGRFEIPVLISLQDAPAWAMTAAGPDPTLTSNFVLELANKFGSSFQALELFPGANTQAGWGEKPNPKAYLALFDAIQGAITQAGQSILVVAAGLTPLSANQTPNENLDDLAFLAGLYDAGAKQDMSIISLRLPALVGDPTQVPSGSEHHILRHYEEVRQVMLDHNDAAGIIWLTGFSWNPGKNQNNDVSLNSSLEMQSKWMTQAYQQLCSQLYIGVAFLSGLNSQGGAGVDANVSLIQPDGSLHPFYDVLKNLIAQNNPGPTAKLSFDKPQNKHIIKLRNDSP